MPTRDAVLQQLIEDHRGDSHLAVHVVTEKHVQDMYSTLVKKPGKVSPNLMEEVLNALHRSAELECGLTWCDIQHQLHRLGAGNAIPDYDDNSTGVRMREALHLLAEVGETLADMKSALDRNVGGNPSGEDAQAYARASRARMAIESFGVPGKGKRKGKAK